MGLMMKFNKPKKVKLKENAQRLQNYYDNKERILAQQKLKYHSNIQSSREKEVDRRKNDIKNLTDRYVKQIITRHSDLTFNDIFDELVVAKRQEIQMKRLLKETNKCQKK